jgi:hypothetical protein
LRECWLAHERLRVSETRSNNRVEVLTARTDAVAEAAEVAAAEAAAAKTAQAALAPELPKEPGGGADGMAEDAKDLPAGPSREAFHRLLADRGGGKAATLDLVEMLGHKGESYSQAVAELGFQLMAHAADGQDSCERDEGL